jgi:hypothetical protein
MCRLTDIQQTVCSLGLSGLTCETIRRVVPEAQHHRQVSKCLTRAAVGIPCHSDSACGRPPDLWDEDQETQTEIVKDSQHDLHPLTVLALIGEPQALRDAQCRAARHS